MSESPAADDLTAVTCNTRKETGHNKQCARTDGLLCACLTGGIIGSLREVFGSKSVHQKYLFVAALVWSRGHTTIVHDDAYRLQKICEARST